MNTPSRPSVPCAEFEEAILRFAAGVPLPDDARLMRIHIDQCAYPQHQLSSDTRLAANRMHDAFLLELTSVNSLGSGPESSSPSVVSTLGAGLSAAAISDLLAAHGLEDDMGDSAGEDDVACGAPAEATSLGLALKFTDVAASLQFTDKASYAKPTILLDDSEATAFHSALAEQGIRQQAHIKYLRGCRLGHTYQFGLAPASDFWPLLSALARKRLVPVFGQKRLDYLVCHTEAMYTLGRQLAAAGVCAEDAVLLALGSNKPIIVSWPGECSGKRVGVLVDVVLSGSMLSDLCCTIQRDLHANVVFSACLVSQGYRGPHSRLLTALVEEASDDYVDPCPRCSLGEAPRYFDHSSGVLFSRAYSATTSESWRQHLADFSEWWRWIEESNALDRHRRLEGFTYEFFVDTAKLLENDTARAGIRRQVRERLHRLDPFGAWVILHRASRNRRPALVAELVAKELQLPIVAATTGQRGFCISDRNAISGKDVLIVDAAVNSGTSVRALTSLARSGGATRVAAFVLLSRLQGEEVQLAIDRILDVPLMYLFPLPFRAIKTSTKEREAFRSALETLEQLDTVGRYRTNRLHAHPGHGERAPERIAADREIARQLWESKCSDWPARLFGAFCTAGEFKRALQMLPKEWAELPHTREALCSLVQNGVPRGVLETVCRYLVNASCFEWLADRWLSKHVRLLNEPGDSWGFIAVAIHEACRRDPDLRVNLSRELRELHEASGADSRQTVLFDNDVVSGEARARERLRVLRDIIAP